MSRLWPLWRTSPSTRQRMATPSSGNSVSTHGPMGQKVSAPFARVKCFSVRCTSRAVTSLRHVKPNRCSRTRSGAILLIRVPTTTASSASWWTSADQGGSRMASPGPITAEAGFRKKRGSLGSSFLSSLACSA